MTVIPKDPLTCDLLVLGSGIAGLRGGIEASRAGWKVFVATKDQSTESNTEYAQGGIAVPLADDDIERHYQDTIKAGDGLCDPASVRLLVNDGRERVRELIEWGAEFDRVGGLLSYTREAAHSRNRILHSHGDATGRELERVLTLKAKTMDNITLFPFHTGMSLIEGDNGCRGAWILDERKNVPLPVLARAVLISTGGVGRIFQESTNPAVTTGDGIAMALNAGMMVEDLEFVQFHPTVLFLKGAPRFLLSESMRGEGGVLRNAAGERFMKRYHPGGDLAPRDAVARAVVSEIKAQGGKPVTLDMRSLDASFVEERFPTISAKCAEYGLNLATDLIPVHPAAHYIMGGIKTDEDGRTSMEGAYAAGEVASAGVHGANRLASNSLLEGLVFSYRAMRHALDTERKISTVPIEPPPIAACGDLGWVNDARRRIASFMWEDVGIIRNEKGLLSARAKLAEERRRLETGCFNRRALETANMALVGDAVAASALYRTESRGGHYREDFPERDDVNWKRHTRLVREVEDFRFVEETVD